MAFIIILMLVGISLMLAEILVASGIGLAGILGLLSLAASCFYAFSEFGSLVGTVVTVFDVAAAVVLTIFIVRSRIRKKLSGSRGGRKKGIFTDDSVSVGDRGVSVSELSPDGTVRLGSETVPVTALEGKIDRGADVEVVLIEDGRIYVKPANDDF